MKEQIAKVLGMIQDGKIDAEKGAELLSLIQEEKKEEAVRKTAYLSKHLRVHIQDGEDEVNVNLPLKLVMSLMNGVKGALPSLLERSNVDGDLVKNIDFELILTALENEVEGPLVDIKDSNGAIVRIVVE